MGGGLPMPEIFGPLFRSAFLVNKKSLFLQKCQCIELMANSAASSNATFTTTAATVATATAGAY